VPKPFPTKNDLISNWLDDAGAVNSLLAAYLQLMNADGLCNAQKSI